MAKRTHTLYKYMPRWVAKVYGILAIVTVPWTLYLALTLPTRHISNHWDIVWVGLDVGIIIMLATTAFFAYIGTEWFVLAATSTATLLIVDAWFDIWTARRGRELISAVVLAFVVELPLAVITATLATKIMAEGMQERNLK